MDSILNHFLLSKYLPMDSEDYFQARVLLLLHFAVFLMMGLVLLVTPATGSIMQLMQGIFLLSLISIFIIRVGYLPAATLLSYSGMGL